MALTLHIKSYLCFIKRQIYMTPNKSMELSYRMQELIRTDLLQTLSSQFPFSMVELYHSKSGKGKRDRVYNDENTLLTMLTTAFQDDKSLENSVLIFSDVFHARSAQLQKEEAVRLEKQKEQDAASKEVIKGRPKKYKPKLAKSKTKEISLNTAGYSKARKRVDVALLEQVFDYSSQSGHGPLWQGMEVYIADGTYFQMQDTPSLRSKYYVKEGDGAYPQGLLESFVRQGTGQIAHFMIGTRHQSELELCAALIKKLKPGSLLIADDLY